MKRRNFLKSQHVRQYRSDKFKNPFKRENKSLKRLRRFFIAFGVIAVLTSIPVLIFKLEFFRIRNIEISGLESIPEEEVRGVVSEHLSEKWLGVFPQNHRFFFSMPKLEEKLFDTFFFEELGIDLMKKNTVYIWTHERVTSLVWLTDQDAYFLDLDGTITRELLETEKNPVRERLGIEQVALAEGEQNTPLLSDMPIIKDVSGSQIEIRQEIFNSEYVENIITFDKGIRQQILEPYMYEIENPETSWMTLHTKNGFYIMFDPELDVSEQLNMLQVVLTEYTDRIEELNYIDLRFGNHVFVK